MKDYEFLFHYWLPRTDFWEVVELIKGHEVFAKKRSNQKQAPPAHQLLVLLKFLGMSGDGANQLLILDHFGGILGGHGTVHDCTWVVQSKPFGHYSRKWCHGLMRLSMNR